MYLYPSVMQIFSSLFIFETSNCDTIGNIAIVSFDLNELWVYNDYIYFVHSVS